MKRSALLGVLLAVVLAPQALGHAEYQSSEPPKGSQLRDAPTEVLVRFTERVETSGTNVEVHDAEGHPVHEGPVIVVTDPPSARVNLKAIGEGAYLVTWKTLSAADGHTIFGTFGFAVGNATAPGETTGEAQAGVAAIASRSLALVGWTLAFGAIVYGLWMRLPIKTKVVAAGSLVTGTATLAFLMLSMQAADVPLLDALATRTGQLLALRAALAFAAIAFLRRPLLAGGLLAASALAGVLGGHASAWSLFAVMVAWVHVLAVGAWVGGLVHLAASPGREEGRLFGRLALPAVITIAITGILEAWILTGASPGQIGPLLASTYGRALAAKVALFGVMLGLAAWARYWLLRRPEAQGLRRSASVEAAFGVVVLILAGVLASTSPPRADHETQLEAEGEEFRYLLTFEGLPEAGGHSVLRIAITTQDGTPVVEDTCGRPTPCLTLRVTPPGARGPETLQAGFEQGLRTVHFLWSRSGDWAFELEFSSAEVFRDRASVTVTVA